MATDTNALRLSREIATPYLVTVPAKDHEPADDTAPMSAYGSAHGTAHDDPRGSLLTLEPGRVVGLVGWPGGGLTRLGLSLLAEPARRGHVAVVDVRGWMCPSAAWEVGVPAEHLVVVRCEEPVLWGRVVSGLLDGMTAVYAEVPPRIKDAQLRKLTATARSRKIPLVLRPVSGELPSGVSYLELRVRDIAWEGTGRGHGRLGTRRITLEASGKAVYGMTTQIEIVDDGTNPVRVVPGLGAAPAVLA